MQDSNLRHSACKAATLPTELIVYMERHPGLEPEPSVWKTDMLGRYTNATHAGPDSGPEAFAH